ncbi:MAG TPA: patatin-like phospholipase family protein [Acidiferrobacterales bacterium]|nr:patatin-like phospholipase family protein [Acidiferrobacterales bacterium]
MASVGYRQQRIGLILSGGGARAAYQVGVLKAIAQMLPKEAPNPFPIICGTSAGAVNSAALAIYARRFQEGVRRLVTIWENFHVHHVFRADTVGVAANGARWIGAMLLGGMGRYNPVSLFDRTPLQELLTKYLPIKRIQASIDAGALRAISITASGYTSGQSIAFYQGMESLTPWKRARRIGCATEITIDHLMASSAIPFVFPAVKLNREYFGDGSMRQMAPISPALHLGADRVLVVGVRQSNMVAPPRLEQPAAYPSFAQIGGHVLNSIFLDSLETDLERLQRINRTVRLVPPNQLRDNGIDLRPIEVLVISPSEDLGKIADRHKHTLPRPVRFMLRRIGALNREGSDLVSYLLFEKPYCSELIDLGFADTMKRKEEVLTFLGLGLTEPEKIAQLI